MTMKYIDEVLIGANLGISSILTAIEENPVYQVISFILSLATSILGIAYIIWKWYRKAKADGKVTEDEVDELVDELHDAIAKGEDKEDNGSKKEGK